MLWKVGSAVGVKAEAQVVWDGGVLGSLVAEFGRIGGLNCWEFWKRWSVGFCKDFRCLWVVLGQEWSWNRGAEVLEFWVRLGGELGVV